MSITKNHQKVINKKKNEIKKTAHSTYRLQYSIVFVQRYRRKMIYGQLKKKGMRKLCEEKG